MIFIIITILLGLIVYALYEQKINNAVDNRKNKKIAKAIKYRDEVANQFFDLMRSIYKGREEEMKGILIMENSFAIRKTTDNEKSLEEIEDEIKDYQHRIISYANTVNEVIKNTK